MGLRGQNSSPKPPGDSYVSPTLFSPRGAPPPRAGPLASLAKPQALTSFTSPGTPSPGAGPLASFLKCVGAPPPPLLLGACAPRNGSRLFAKPQALLRGPKS